MDVVILVGRMPRSVPFCLPARLPQQSQSHAVERLNPNIAAQVSQRRRVTQK
jgi:hypothetical protein